MLSEEGKFEKRAIVADSKRGEILPIIDPIDHHKETALSSSATAPLLPTSPSCHDSEAEEEAVAVQDALHVVSSSSLKQICFKAFYSEWLPTALAITCNITKSFIFGTALFPMEAYGDWAAATVVGGAFVLPLSHAVDALTEYNQDVRATLRAQTSNDSAVAGFAKLVGKHIIVPSIPVALVAYGIAGPDKNLGHPFVHAFLHTTVGYVTYAMSSALAESKWPALEEVEQESLQPMGRFVQNYIASPLLASGPRTALMAELLRRTKFDIFIRLETQGMHAPVVFGMLFFICHALRVLTAEYREPQQRVTFWPSIDNAEDYPKEEFIERISVGNPQKIRNYLWTGFKVAAVGGGALAGNTLYTYVSGSAHDGGMQDRMQRYSFVAMGMYTVKIALDGVEKIKEKLSQHYAAFFVRPTKGAEQLIEQLTEPLLASEHKIENSAVSPAQV